jgi:hypothetical protein
MDYGALDTNPVKPPETAGRHPTPQLAEPHSAPCRPDHPRTALADLAPDIRILTLAYPEFTISEPGIGRNGPTWTAIRKDPAQPGLYAAVTPDLNELRNALARHASRSPDGHHSALAPARQETPMPPLLPAEPAPASYRNPDRPADQALTAIMTMLANHGYDSCVPARDGDAFLRISNAVQALTDLTITSGGEIIWDYRTFRYPHTSPGRLIGTAIEILDPDHFRPLPAVPPEHDNLTPLGATWRALAACGFDGGLARTGTGSILVVSNPRQLYRGSVTMSSDGEVRWRARAPHHPDGGIPLPSIAATITRALTRTDHRAEVQISPARDRQPAARNAYSGGISRCSPAIVPRDLYRMATT